MKGRLIILLFIALNQTYAQGIFDDKLPTSRQDTLRGSITPERAWWDLTYYHLDIKVEPDKKYISGSNTVGYKVLESNKVMQIDLQKPMNITSITNKNKELAILKNRIAKLYDIKIEYFELRNKFNLRITNKLKDSKIFISYYLNKVRLIDNI